MSEALHLPLERLWFDFNYGGLAVSEDQLYSWSFPKIRKVYDWFKTQKKLEDDEVQRIKAKTKT